MIEKCLPDKDPHPEIMREGNSHNQNNWIWNNSQSLADENVVNQSNVQKVRQIFHSKFMLEVAVVLVEMTSILVIIIYTQNFIHWPSIYNSYFVVLHLYTHAYLIKSYFITSEWLYCSSYHCDIVYTNSTDDLTSSSNNRRNNQRSMILQWCVYMYRI